jgi:pimeloyl-ACP methyl ester carboxylesterase
MAAMSTPYLPLRPPESHTREIRGLRQHCQSWPGEGAPLVLLHGFMDCGATFQFLVDALAGGRAVVAPDWRGFGRSGWSPAGYWFPEYFADLEAWLDLWCPGAPADLVGHSMGGNIALMFAGLRPGRVRRLVTLEGFGLPATRAEMAPARYRDWLDQLRAPEPATIFPGIDVLAAVLRKRNPRLTPERAAFVAGSWSEALPDGRVRLRFDPAHKRVNPVLYRREEVEACWREVQAAVLYVAGAESEFMQRLGGAADPQAMRAHIARLEPRVVPGSGHMLHHDQPEAVARLIEDFLAPDTA